jgi:hypothetical protein
MAHVSKSSDSHSTDPAAEQPLGNEIEKPAI